MCLCPYKYVLRRAKGQGKQYQVVDEAGGIHFYARRKHFAFGDTIVVSDLAGNEVVYIQRGFSLIVPMYRVSIVGYEPFTVKRKMSLWSEYRVSHYNWVIIGETSRYRCYAAECENKILFEMRSISDSWKDRFLIELSDRNYLLESVGIALAIDAGIDDIRKTSKS